MLNRRTAVFAAVLLSGAAIAWAQTAMRPGQYEVAVVMAMPGVPEPVQITQRTCLSPDEARDQQRLIAELLATEEDCPITNIKSSGSKLTWDTTCDDVTASSELTFAADGFVGEVKTTIDGMVITAKVSGNWVSTTCTADE